MPIRVFIYEHTCGGCSRPCPPSLRTEGHAMLAAVLADFRRVPGVEAITLLAEGLAATGIDEPFRRVRHGEEETAFRAAARQADYTLVIAPESDDLLLTRCRWAEEEGSALLGPAPATVALTADKQALCRHLQAHGVPTPDTLPLAAGLGLTVSGFPAVLKPRHGAGSIATFLARDVDALLAVLEEAHQESDDELLLQPYVPGTAASVAFLIGPRQHLALPPAVQELSADGRFRYLGGSVPLPAPLAERAERLARRAVDAVPGLRGYVGVDMVLGVDSSQDSVIEINPRLTTSYVGLRALAADNLAEAMLAIVQGAEAPAPRWRPGRVEFRADGEIHRSV